MGQYTAMTYSFPNFEPVHYSMSRSSCFFLICIQVSQETGKVVWYSHLFMTFLQFVVIHTVKGFRVVNEQRQMFFMNSLAFSMIQLYVDNLIFGSCAFSKSSLYIWKFLVHILLKSSLKDFEHVHNQLTFLKISFIVQSRTEFSGGRWWGRDV